MQNDYENLLADHEFEEALAYLRGDKDLDSQRDTNEGMYSDNMESGDWEGFYDPEET